MPSTWAGQLRCAVQGFDSTVRGEHASRLTTPLLALVQGMPKRVMGARIACLDMNLQKARMHMGVQVRQGRATSRSKARHA